MGIGDKIQDYLAQKDAAQAKPPVVVEPPPAVVEPPAAKAEPSMASVMEMMVSLIAQMKTAQSGEQAAQMLSQADLLQQILVKTKPENTAAPMISVYSYPEGERDRPKPPLKCEMTQVGYKMDPNVLTVAEIEALNALRPGVFRVTKADGASIEFRVTAIIDSQQRLERLDLWYPCKGVDRHNHRSLLDYCHEAMGQPLPSMAELMNQLSEMRAKLAAVAA